MRTLLLVAIASITFLVQTDILLSTDNRNILDAPVIDNISKIIFTEGETVRINGKNFGDQRGNSYASFAGVVGIEYNLWSDVSIIAVIPEGIKTGKLTVWVNGIKSNEIDYTYQKKYKQLETVLIGAGSFMMGDKSGSGFDNTPEHKVTITRDFEISIKEVSQKDWKIVMDGSNPSQITDTGDAKPVQQVTFVRAAEFCNRLSLLEGYTPVYQITGDEVVWDTRQNGYRLPTEAEWEYAAKAGRTEDYITDEIKDMGWVSENAGNHSQPVGTRKPNDWGIYDMFGNVSEWCWDYYDDSYYSKSPENDPMGPSESVIRDRIIRGGAYQNGADMCNAFLRNSFPGTADDYIFYLGLRVVRNKIGLDVNDKNNSNDIFIYPNPASDFIEISYPPSEKRGIGAVSPAGGGQGVDIRIFDILGACVIKVEQTSPSVQRIDIPHLAPGIYFVRMGNEVRKFVKI